MIDSIEIFNFRLHQHIKVDFDEGITCIAGLNQVGKSTILKAMLWVLENRPLGDDYISHKARNKTGKQILDTRVIVRKGDNYVERKKTPTFNGYIVNGVVFENIGTSVPNEVTKFFNLSTENIQRQQETPFLLSETGSTITKYFNNIINLSVIDTTEEIASSNLRKTNGKIKVVEANITRHKDQLKELPNVAALETLIDNIEQNKSTERKVQDDLVQIDRSIQTIDELFKQLLALPNVAIISKQYEAVQNNVAQKNTLESIISNLSELLSTKESLYLAQSKIPNTFLLLELIKNVDANAVQLNDVNNIIDVLMSLCESQQALQVELPTIDVASQLSVVSEINNRLAQKNRINNEINEIIEKKYLIDLLTRQKEAIKGISLSPEIILQYEAITGGIEALSDLTRRKAAFTAEINDITQEITRLRKNMPDTCPTCNQKINKELI
jgi:DNA repair protein SbcC/Rad50